jgi:hypothetical protein
MKAMVLIAALAVVSASPSFAQTVEPIQHKAAIVDTLIGQADTVRCAVIPNDLTDKMLLSNSRSRSHGHLGIDPLDSPRADAEPGRDLTRRTQPTQSR